jgi:hypothetical protein
MTKVNEKLTRFGFFLVIIARELGEKYLYLIVWLERWKRQHYVLAADI